MRKNLTIFCVFALSLFLVGYAFAENNAMAYFMLDKNLATAGYQEGSTVVTGIGPSQNVGFTVYALNWDNAKGFTIKFEWDATKIAFRPTSSFTTIEMLDEMTINGEATTPPDEENLLGTSIMTPGAITDTGSYEVSYAMQGGDAVASPAEGGLVFYAVFRTLSSFQAEDQASVKVTVTAGDEDGVPRFLGERNFYVNPVAVKDATWGEVKTQFKNF